MPFHEERERAYLQRTLLWHGPRLRRRLLFSPLVLVLFALLQAAILQVSPMQMLRLPSLWAGAAAMLAIAWGMTRIQQAQRFAMAGLLLQPTFLLTCALSVQPGRDALILVLPLFLATPLATAPLWARRSTTLASAATATLAAAIALWRCGAEPMVWWAFAIQASLGTAVSIGIHTAVDTARRRYFLVEESLAERARIDSLTTLINRRHFYEQGEEWVHASERSGEALSACFIDIDQFKPVNDAHGHRTGDRVLKAVAEVLGRIADDRRLPARLGGDEFAILLRGYDAGRAHEEAEFIRRQMERIRIEGLEVTVSIGTATRRSGESLPDLLHRSDLALLEAKQAGRNRVARCA